MLLLLALMKRYWTADRRQCHGLEANELCFLCDQERETIDHIDVSYSFAKQVWRNISNVMNPTQGMATQDTILDWWNEWRSQRNRPRRRDADSIFALIAWELWT